jgi:TRAP-type C4-dicarboxylate transport system permease small subunit
MTEPGKAVSGWRRTDLALAGSLRVLCIATFLVLLALVTLAVLIRFVPMFSLGWADEIVEMAFAWMVFLGTAALWRTRAHFRVDLVSGMLTGTRAGRILEIVLSLLALVFFLVFTYEGAMLTLRAVAPSPILALPRRLWYLAMPVSGSIMILYTFRDLWLLLHGQMGLTPDAVKEGHA